MNLISLPTCQETKRLLLRPFAAGDWAGYANYHARPEVYAFLYRASPTGTALRDQFDRVLRARFEGDGDVYRLAVTLKEGGAIAGEDEKTILSDIRQYFTLRVSSTSTQLCKWTSVLRPWPRDASLSRHVPANPRGPHPPVDSDDSARL